MSRLIDAERLNFAGQNYNKSQMKAILDFIDAQPTVYNVDGVIEQLVIEQEKLETDMWAEENENWYGQYCNGMDEGIGRAINIISGDVK